MNDSTIIAVEAGSIHTLQGRPGCFRVLDHNEHDVNGGTPVDLACAFRLLNALAQARRQTG